MAKVKSNVKSKNSVKPKPIVKSVNKSKTNKVSENNKPSSTKVPKEREYKYYREDFKDLPVKVVHIDLVFDIYDTYTNVVSDLNLEARQDISSISLNANNLEITKIICTSIINGKKANSVLYYNSSNNSSLNILKTYNYNKEENQLLIQFNRNIKKGERFIIHSEDTIRPNKNILEGLYFDETPIGAPQQQITQCQQWGFQRLTPCIDEMDAKCTYKTKIIADSRYTHLISNGNIVEKRKDIGKGRSTITYENQIPMAPYLFFLGVGTYAEFSKICEYANGKTFKIELLAPPTSKSKPEIGQQAVEMLYYGVQWINIFTGEEQYLHTEEKKKIWELIKKRDLLKDKLKGKQTIELKNICTELKSLSSKFIKGYEYNREVYREIGMQNSNFGGMENVGNTTIVTNKIMPFEDMPDRAFEYMLDVKAHEFYHNLNGSEVTAKNPFDLWLNEAVTVDIERAFHAFMFGEDYTRLGEVAYMVAPGGILDEDTGSVVLPIEVDQFNTPDDLITGVTYVKAPEFVNMVRQIIGENNYAKALALYHQRFKGGNGTSKDWLSAMEQISGISLDKFAKSWLKKIGYPVLNVKSGYEDSKFKIQFFTNGWEFPLKFALVDKDGNDIYEKTIIVKEANGDIPGTEMEFDLDKNELNQEVAFISLNRGFSFYGKVLSETSKEELYLQAQLDKDIIGRYLAYFKIAEAEKRKLLENPGAKISKDFIDLYLSILSNKDLLLNAGSAILAISESVEDEHLNVKYEELYQARIKIMSAISKKYQEEIKDMYLDISKDIAKISNAVGLLYIEKQKQLIKLRQIKTVCLGLLSYIDTPEIHHIIKQQIKTADNATDLVAAQLCYLRSSASDRLKILDEFNEYSKKNLVRWELFLSVVGGNEGNDAIDIIKRVEKLPNFRIDQSNDQRIYLRFAMNKRKSLQSVEGRKFMKEKILQLSTINEYTTCHILSNYGKIKFLEEPHKKAVISDLKEILAKIDPKKATSVYNTLKKLLKGL